VREVAAALGPYLLVVALSFLWALTEILQTFRSDIRRALRSGWSALLIGVNVLFALLVFALARYLAPPSVNPYLLALGVGAGWQALLRTRINLLQPLTPEAGEAVSLQQSRIPNQQSRIPNQQQSAIPNRGAHAHHRRPDCPTPSDARAGPAGRRTGAD
jgi:hypothetical protein